MRKIAVLDQHTIDKIAAGEVVERPSSVVKELIENAIDAGATAITVEIKNGGKSLIRITDNGSGMEKDQVPLAFLRHATSKIQQVEDLAHIAFLGFRGEALSSIAAVSQAEMITKTPSAMSGVRYVIEGGQEKVFEEIGAPDGTTLLVRHLFYNTPARSKFLKTDATEGGYISSLLEQMALSHPEISFKYMLNGQVKLHTPGNYNVGDVIYQIYGREITRELLEIHYQEGALKIHGFVGRPQLSRGNRGFENYSVNGRFVKDAIITRAIEDAYKGYVMQHKFPFVTLAIQIEGSQLDVNVHPSKMEVRFSNGQEVYQAVYNGISQTLSGRELIPQIHVDAKRKTPPPQKELPKKQEIPEPFEKQRREALALQEQGNYLAKAGETALEKAAPQSFPKPAPSGKAADSKKPEETARKAGKSKIEEQQFTLFDEKLLSQKARNRHKLIGQIFDTYWLVEYEENFYIIDQHAAHEKVLYERLVDAQKKQAVSSQYISPPLVVTVNLQEEERLLEHLPLFESFGFEIRHFGGKEYTVSAVPTNLYQMTEQELFRELLDQLEADERQGPPELFAQRLATMACKAAVKGGQTLSRQEADALIDELLHLDNPYHCPHGRPTIVSMSRRELEKKFKRIV